MMVAVMKPIIAHLTHIRQSQLALVKYKQLRHSINT